jgi:hypothetical protein
MTLPEVAEGFHSRGYNVLLYDARSVGGSQGQPRNLVDPLQMAEDLSGISSPTSYEKILLCAIISCLVRYRHLHIRISPAHCRLAQHRALGHVVWRRRQRDMRSR